METGRRNRLLAGQVAECGNLMAEGGEALDNGRLRFSHANACFDRESEILGVWPKGMRKKERWSLILQGPNPILIDIKGHLGLGFWTEPN
ncbi:MAG: hypothetical protein ACLQOO_05195 [Terriglobia bacterium]